MDTRNKLSEIRQVVEQARSMPMSASAVVNRAELLALLDELEQGISAAGDDGQEGPGRAGADQIIRAAETEQARLVSESEVSRKAKLRAEEMVTQAQVEADELRKESDEYVDSNLANFEVTLARTLETVKRGRLRLAERSQLDSMSAAELDEVKLPGYLDR